MSVPRSRAMPVLRILMALLVLVVLARLVNLRAALDVLGQIDPLWVPVVLALFGLGEVLSCVRWRLGLQQMTDRPPSVWALLRLYLIGMFVNLGVPTQTGGDIVRAEIAHAHIGARGSAYASILADRVIGAVAVVLIAVVSTLAAGDLIDAGVRRSVMISLLVLPFVGLAALAVLRHGGRLGRFAPFGEALSAFLRRPLILSASLGIAIVVQCVGIIIPTGLLAHAMGIDVPFGIHFAFVPVIVLVSLLPIGPNGLGVRETAFVVLYGHVGVSSEAAFALGLAWTLVLTFFGLVGGLVMLFGRSREARVA